MKVLSFCLASLLGLAVAQEVSYNGYHAFSIAIEDDFDEIKEKLSDLDVVSLECEEGHTERFNVAVSPDSLPDFEALGLPVTVLSEDLGADFARESAFEEYGMTNVILSASPPSKPSNVHSN